MAAGQSPDTPNKRQIGVLPVKNGSMQLSHTRWRQLVAAASAGVLLAAMTYVRAVALPFVVLPAGLVWWRYGWRSAGLLAVTFVLCVAPWVLRNAALTDYPHFSSAGAIVLYRYNAAMLYADKHDMSFVKAQKILTQKLKAQEDQVVRAKYAGREARRMIFDAPFRYLWLHARTVPTNLLPAAGDLLQMFGVEVGQSGTLRVIRQQGIFAGVKHYFAGNWTWFWAALPAVGITGLLYVFAAAGVWGSFRQQGFQGVTIFLLLTFVYFLFVSGGAAHPRFRVPVMPVLSIFAGYGAVYLWVMAKQLMRRWPGGYRGKT